MNENAVNKLKNRNIENYSLLKNQTDKVQPADRHVIRYVQCYLRKKFEVLRMQQAKRMEKKLKYKIYDLSAMRMKIAVWFNDSVPELNSRKGLLYQSWTNMGIFEKIDGSNDNTWKEKVLNCEKRKNKKCKSKYIRKAKELEMLLAYKEMIEQDNLAQGVLQGKLDKKKQNQHVIDDDGLQSGTDEDDDDM